jgi:hypothetical protein
MNMAERSDSRLKKDLQLEIAALEEQYNSLKKFIAGENADIIEIAATLQGFKDGLSRASAFVLALYTLQGQRVKIPWDPLFTSLDYALATINVTASGKQTAALRAILVMSKAQIDQVMDYFNHLKDALKA